MGKSGGEASGGWVDLAPDLRAWLAKPQRIEQAPGIVLFIEAFGVNAHMRNVAGHFAAAGYLAIVPDIYHGKTFAYGDMDNVLPQIRALDEKRVMQETTWALKRLAQEGAAGLPAVAGYCLGGRLAFRAGLELGERLAAVVSYYGGGIGPEQERFGRELLAGRAAEMGAPILLHYGSEDQSIAADEHGRVATALSRAGKRYLMSVYPGAGHGFDCNERPSYHPAASAEAWDLTLEFLAAHRRH